MAVTYGIRAVRLVLLFVSHYSFWIHVPAGKSRLFLMADYHLAWMFPSVLGGTVMEREA